MKKRGRPLIALAVPEVCDMEYRILSETEYELSKALWLECFPEDGKEFVDWYYSDRSRPEYVLGAFSDGGGTPSAMLHMIPVEMRFGRRNESVCLVSGVCTKPEQRGRGLCSALFERAFPIMLERGAKASVLQPFDPDFYRRFGYKTYILRREAELDQAFIEAIVRSYGAIGRKYEEPVRPDPKLLFRLYSGFMLGCSGCTVRSPEYFEGFIKEYSLDGARLTVTRRGCCAGYAEGDTFTATELFYASPDSIPALLPKGFKRWIVPLPAFAVPPKGSVTALREFSMLKPLSPDFKTGRGELYGFDRY